MGNKRQDVVKEKIKAMMPANPVYENGVNDLHLANHFTVLDNEVSDIHRNEKGTISFSEGKDGPHFFLSELNDRELEDLYRSLITTQLSNDIVKGKGEVELPKSFDVPISKETLDVLDKEDFTYLEVSNVTSSGDTYLAGNGMKEAEVYLEGNCDGSLLDPVSIRLDNFDFDQMQEIAKGVDNNIAILDRQQHHADLERFITQAGDDEILKFSNPVRDSSGCLLDSLEMYSAEEGVYGINVFSSESSIGKDYDSLPVKDEQIVYEAAKEQYYHDMLEQEVTAAMEEHGGTYQLDSPVKLANGENVSHFLESDEDGSVYMENQDHYTVSRLDSSRLPDTANLYKALISQRLRGELINHKEVFGFGKDLADGGINIKDSYGKEYHITALYPNSPLLATDVIIKGYLKEAGKQTDISGNLSEPRFSDDFIINLRDKADEYAGYTERLQAFNERYKSLEEKNAFKPGNKIPVNIQGGKDSVFKVFETDFFHRADGSIDHDIVTGTVDGVGVIMRKEEVQNMHDAYMQAQVRKHGQTMQLEYGDDGKQNIYYQFLGSAYIGSNREPLKQWVDQAINNKDAAQLAILAPMSYLIKKPHHDIFEGGVFADLHSDFIPMDSVISTAGVKAEADRYAVSMQKTPYPYYDGFDEHNIYADVFKKVSIQEVLDKYRSLSDEDKTAVLNSKGIKDEKVKILLSAEAVREGLQNQAEKPSENKEYTISDFEERYSPLKFEESDVYKIIDFYGNEDEFVIKNDFPDLSDDMTCGYFDSAGREYAVPVTKSRIQGMHNAYLQKEDMENGNILKEDNPDIYYMYKGELHPSDADGVKADFEKHDYKQLVIDAPTTYDNNMLPPEGEIDFENISKTFMDNKSIKGEKYESSRYAVSVFHDGNYNDWADPYKNGKDYAHLYEKYTKNELVSYFKQLSPEKQKDVLVGCSEDILPVLEDVLGLDEGRKYGIDIKRSYNKPELRPVVYRLDSLTTGTDHFNFKEPVELSDGNKITGIIREGLWLDSPDDEYCYTLQYDVPETEDNEHPLDSLSENDLKKLFDGLDGENIDYGQYKGWYINGGTVSPESEDYKELKQGISNPDIDAIRDIIKKNDKFWVSEDVPTQNGFTEELFDKYDPDYAFPSLKNDNESPVIALLDDYFVTEKPNGDLSINHIVSEDTADGIIRRHLTGNAPEDAPSFGEAPVALKERAKELVGSGYFKEETGIARKMLDTYYPEDNDTLSNAPVSDVHVQKKDSPWLNSAELQGVLLDYGKALAWWKDHDYTDGQLQSNHYSDNQNQVTAVMESVWTEISPKHMRNAVFLSEEDIKMRGLELNPAAKELKVIAGVGDNRHVVKMYNLDYTNIDILMQKPGEEGQHWRDVYKGITTPKGDTARTRRDVLSVMDTLRGADSERLKRDPRYVQDILDKSILGKRREYQSTLSEEVSLAEDVSHAEAESRDREDTRKTGLKL